MLAVFCWAFSLNKELLECQLRLSLQNLLVFQGRLLFALQTCTELTLLLLTL